MMENVTALATLAPAILLAAVHLVAGKMRFLEGIPRSRWLSFAGGVSVAYVFVHMLPELGARQEDLETAGILMLTFLEHHVYLIALAGLTLFYGLERAAVVSRADGKSSDSPTPPRVFRLHLVSYAVYNFIVGYLLVHREDQTPWGLTVYTAAMGLHFVVNDFGLREHHKQRYHTPGRWVLAAAVAAGWGCGVATEISEGALTVLFAFLAGGVVLNVLKEELPEKRKSRFGAFAFGTAFYAALLLAAG